MFGIEPDEEDEGTRELDAKVETVLRDIAKASATIPEEFPKAFDEWAKKYPDADWEGFLKKIYEELPKVSSILGNWTASLSAYATYRAFKRQERINEKILASNRILAGSTVVLAVATFALVLLNVVRG
jgi:transketolase